MSKITNGGVTRSGTGCFVALAIATVGVKGLTRQMRPPPLNRTAI